MRGMVSIENKEETLREAVSRGKVIIPQNVLNMIVDKKIPKGDVFEQSRIAGILAAKKTSEFIPLCHPIRLTSVRIEFNIVSDGIEVESRVSAIDRTGVEMEALTAASTACLNIYDMCKKFDRGIRIENIRLVEKSGGASGNYKQDHDGYC